MVNRRSIDFVVHMLDVTVLHVSFPFFLIPCLKLYKFANEDLAFIIAAIYAVVLFVTKILYGLHKRSQRLGGKIDWEDEVVLITGGNLAVCLIASRVAFTPYQTTRPSLRV